MLYWLFNKHFKIAVIKVKDTELEDFYSFLDALKESNENQPIHIYELRLHIDNTTGMRVDEERERKRVLESMHVVSKQKNFFWHKLGEQKIFFGVKKLGENFFGVKKLGEQKFFGVKKLGKNNF